MPQLDSVGDLGFTVWHLISSMIGLVHRSMQLPRCLLSVRPRSAEQVPSLTAQVARASNPCGTTAMWVKDRLNGLWGDEDFLDWYPRDVRHRFLKSRLTALAPHPVSSNFEWPDLATCTNQPRRQDDVELPGWWVDHNPDDILPTPGGHANFGMAHGAAGLLALLALATTRACVVDGQHEAIAALTGWFDRWRQDSADGPWWPQWITREELHTGHPNHPGPRRPSWCYGTVGIARAQQLAAIATNDPERQHAAEEALAASLTDTHLDQITEPGLCHGTAGIYQTAYRAANDARDLTIGRRLPGLAARLAQHTDTLDDQQGGLLTGSDGVALALETTRHTAPPRTGWDACLRIT